MHDERRAQAMRPHAARIVVQQLFERGRGMAAVRMHPLEHGVAPLLRVRVGDLHRPVVE